MVGVVPCHHLEDELRDDAGVGRVGGLMRPEDVEVAKADALEPVRAVEGLDVVLAGELLHGIGRERAGQHLLVLGLRGLIAIRRGRRGVNNAANAPRHERQ